MSNISSENTSSETAENKVILQGERINIPKTHFADYLLHHVPISPRSIALKVAQTNMYIRYGHMRARSVLCAIWLRECNVQPGDIITICPSTSIDFYVPFFAGLYIGAIVNIWDARCKLNFHQLRKMKPKVVFADKKNELEMYALLAFLLQQNIFPSIVLFHLRSSQFYILDNILLRIPSSSCTDFSCSSKKKDTDTAVILHTFNVMTVEKNIEIPHSTFLSLLISHMHLLFTQGDWGLLNANLGSYQELRLFVTCIIILSPLTVWWKMDFLSLCRKIELSQIHWIYFNSEQIQGWCDFNCSDGQDIQPISVKPVLFLYEYNVSLCSVHENLLARFSKTRIISLYSYPEVGLISYKYYKFGQYMGKINANTAVAIMSEKTGMVVGPNVHGEICCKCMINFSINGYYQQIASAQLLIDSQGLLQDGCTRVIYYTENGDIFVIGTVMAPIKIRNQLVHPIEINNYLDHINIALDVVVLSLLDEHDTIKLFAYIVKNPAFLNKSRWIYVQRIVRQHFGDSYTLGGMRFIKEIYKRHPTLTVDIKEHYKIFDRFLKTEHYVF